MINNLLTCHYLMLSELLLPTLRPYCHHTKTDWVASRNKNVLTFIIARFLRFVCRLHHGHELKLVPYWIWAKRATAPSWEKAISKYTNLSSFPLRWSEWILSSLLFLTKYWFLLQVLGTDDAKQKKWKIRNKGKIMSLHLHPVPTESPKITLGLTRLCKTGKWNDLTNN